MPIPMSQRSPEHSVMAAPCRSGGTTGRAKELPSEALAPPCFARSRINSFPRARAMARPSPCRFLPRVQGVSALLPHFARSFAKPRCSRMTWFGRFSSDRPSPSRVPCEPCRAFANFL
jgi:hypothetical protein